MQWLTQNPLFTMPGPAFLVVYGLAFAVCFALAIRSRRKMDETKSLPSLDMPERLDPYRVAYLRKGMQEALRLATLELRHLGLLEPLEKNKKYALKETVRIDRDLRDASPILIAVAKHFQVPRKPESLFESGVATQLAATTEEWDRWIENERLRIPNTAKDNHQFFMVLLAALLIGVGGLKLITALRTQHYNIEFLFVAMLITVICFSVLLKVSQLSDRGKRYLLDLQAVHPDHQKVRMEGTPREVQSDFPIVAMGLFGVVALQGSMYDDVYRSYQRSASTSSGCGSSSCGGGGGDGGGGCGGGCGGCGG